MFYLIPYLMLRYTWKHGANQSHELYCESIDTSTGVIDSVHINYKLVFTLDTNKQKIWSLFTPEGDHIDEFYKYINHDLKDRGCSPNTIKMHAYKVKVFFTFLYVMHLKYTDIDKRAKKELINFLKTIPGTSTKTIKYYLSIIRSFLTSMGINDGAMFAKTKVRKDVQITNAFGISRVQGRYDPELPRSKAADVLPPKHVTPWEFARLVEHLAEKRNTMYLVLVMLGYFNAARVGECLGITWEDVILDDDSPRILLRNRLSDRPDQQDKTLITPHCREDYYSREYISETESVYGYIPLDANKNLLLALKCYMSEEKQRILADPGKYALNYADTISPAFVGPDGSNRNYYLFSAKNGDSLNYGRLNYWIIKYFQAVNIPTQNGVFHKLRHGCGMLHSRYLVPPTEREELMIIMRHRTITASAIYTRIPEPELVQRRTELQQRILHEIPALNFNLNHIL